MCAAHCSPRYTITKSVSQACARETVSVVDPYPIIYILWRSPFDNDNGNPSVANNNPTHTHKNRMPLRDGDYGAMMMMLIMIVDLRV